MGLAVVHGIVNSHNGAITVESALGKGTTFAIYLPWIDAIAIEETLPEEVPPHGKGSILFVDDEHAIAVWGQEILAHLGYAVVASTDSTQALEVFRGHRWL